MTEDRRITGAGRALVMAPPRSLAEIARQIRIEWPANTMTRQRITAMDYLGQMEKWEMPEAVNAVRGFLDHCQAWRGTVAQQVKDELLGMLHANGISMRAYRGVGVRR